MVRQRVRIRFSKQGNLRLIGHRDLVRAMERLFRRAGLQLGMSQGFHPKPRMSFPSALAVGMEGLDEVMELELAQEYGEEELLARLTSHTLPGLVFHRVELLPEGTKKAQLQSATYRLPVPADRCAPTAERTERLLAESSHLVQRPKKGTSVDLIEFLEGLRLEDGILEIRLGIGRQASASPRDVLDALELADLEREGAYLTRASVQLESRCSPIGPQNATRRENAE